MEMPFVTIRTPRSGSPGCHRCSKSRNGYHCNRLGNELGITKLNNFEFTSTGTVTCWRAYGVGRGDVIKLDASSSKSSGE